MSTDTQTTARLVYYKLTFEPSAFERRIEVFVKIQKKMGGGGGGRVGGGGSGRM